MLGLFIVVFVFVFRSFHKIAKSDLYLRHVCPSVRPHGTTRLPLDEFSWNFDICFYFEITSKKFEFHYNLTRLRGTLHEDRYKFMIIYRCNFLGIRNFSEKICKENQNTHFVSSIFFNRLTPNDPYMGRTAPLISKRCILYIYSTNISSEYFKHALYSPFFSLQNAVCFITLTCLVPVLFTFYIQDVLKLKK